MSENRTKIEREPVSFTSDGNRLYGMIHFPQIEDNSEVAIILLSAGLKNRIGYGRIYVALADYLATRGYPVMRYDYHGCGDSGGRLSPTGAYHEQHADINGFIQRGLFTEDTLQAIDMAKAKTGCTRFVLCGLCGGSNSSLYTALKSPEVMSTILINFPTALDSSLVRQQNQGKMDAWQLKFLYEAYLRKAFSPRSWLRLLAFKSDYKAIIQVLRTFTSRLRPKGKSNSASEKNQVAEAFNFNDDLLDKLSAYFESSRSAYLLFAENDPITVDFETYFEPDHGRGILEKYKGRWEKTVFKDSNHSYTNWEWREQLFAKVLSCIQREAKLIKRSNA